MHFYRFHPPTFATPFVTPTPATYTKNKPPVKTVSTVPVKILVAASPSIISDPFNLN